MFLFRTTGECECRIQLLIHFHDRSPHPSLQPLRTLLSSPTKEIPEPPGNARAETTEHPPEPPPDSYTVKPNETLYSIATRHGVTVKSLQEANKITKPEALRDGMKLVIPAK